MSYAPARVRNVLAIDTTRLVTVYNRTSRTLSVHVDGRVWDLQPGENKIPAICVPYAQRQHPRMGTFDRGALSGESLIAVPGMTPPEQCTPLQPGREHNGLERIDRVANPIDRPTQYERMPSERTAIDMNAIQEINEAVVRSSIVSANDNGALPAPNLAAAESIE